MHVLFQGLSPSKELSKTFGSHGIRVSLEKPALDLVPDLILVRVKAEDDLKRVHSARKRFPEAWVTVITSDAELDKPTLYAAILNCAEKNSVWHLDTWESVIWFSIQELTRTQQFEKDLKAIHAEVVESHENAERLVKQIEKDLSVAERIQEKLVPRNGPPVPGIQMVTKYIPAPGLGGDYFDIFELQEKRQIGILLVDSETHGMVAALLSILLKLRIENFKKEFETPGSFLKHLEQELGETTKDGASLVSIFFGVIDRNTLNLHYASMGHIRPLVWRKSKEIELEEDGVEHSLPLHPGDTLFLATNGLQKVLGEKTKVRDILSSLGEPIQLNRLKNSLMGKVDAFMEKEKLSDDITFLEIAIDPKALVLKLTS